MRAWMHGGVSFCRKCSNISRGRLRKRKSNRGKAFIRAQREEKFGKCLTISIRISVGRWHRRASFGAAIPNIGDVFRPSVWSKRSLNFEFEIGPFYVMESKGREKRRREEKKKERNVNRGLYQVVCLNPGQAPATLLPAKPNMLINVL
jgi:hypothetical protein